MKRKLKVDLQELDMALDADSSMLEYFLDLETGRVFWITTESSQAMYRIYEEIYDEEENRIVDLEEYLAEQNMEERQKKEILERDRVEQAYGERYIRVERDDRRSAYREMERFIAAVEDDGLRERLWKAIQGRGAFRRFKDVLLDSPDVRDRWFEFKLESARRWLEEHGVELAS